MDKIRVQNLRCLADTAEIEFKPITLLVGANSSGKSTFLRVLPLLRQSAETRTLSGLLLNEGDVNFGFFNEALHRDAHPAELKLTFGTTLRAGIFQGGFINRFFSENISATCELTYAKRSIDHHYPYLRSVVLTLGSNSEDIIEICAEEEGKISTFRVNDYRANGEVAKILLRVGGRGIVPSLVRVAPEESNKTEFDYDAPEGGVFDGKLISETFNLFHGRTGKGTRLAVMSAIKIGSVEQMLASAKSVTGVYSWSQSVQNWTVTTRTFLAMRNLLIARRTGELLSSFNTYISQLARSVHYFQPVRASVERDYLSRDVEVGSVDPKGLNVALVLASLGNMGQAKFRAWTRKYFGFEVYSQSVSDGARVALRMKEGDSLIEHNLADMGFGFSQILPFLVQIWNLIEGQYLSSRSRYVPRFRQSSAFPISYVIAIEQPELHLHPAMQAKLADMFVTVARLSKESKIPIYFVLETHSSAIIERIGSLIEGSHLEPNDVQVLLFERGRDGILSNTATIRASHFDKEGILQDWPFGFLSPPPDQVFPVASNDAQSTAT